MAYLLTDKTGDLWAVSDSLKSSRPIAQAWSRTSGVLLCFHRSRPSVVSAEAKRAGKIVECWRNGKKIKRKDHPKNFRPAHYRVGSSR